MKTLFRNNLLRFQSLALSLSDVMAGSRAIIGDVPPQNVQQDSYNNVAYVSIAGGASPLTVTAQETGLAELLQTCTGCTGQDVAISMLRPAEFIIQFSTNPGVSGSTTITIKVEDAQNQISTANVAVTIAQNGLLRISFFMQPSSFLLFALGNLFVLVCVCVCVCVFA